MSLQMTSRLAVVIVGGVACGLFISAVQHAVAGYTPVSPQVGVGAVPQQPPVATSLAQETQPLADAVSTMPDAELAAIHDFRDHIESVYAELFGTPEQGPLLLDGFMLTNGVYLGSVGSDSFFAIVQDVAPLDDDLSVRATVTLKSFYGEVATDAIIVASEVGGGAAVVIPVLPAGFALLMNPPAAGGGVGGNIQQPGRGEMDNCTQYDCEAIQGVSCEAVRDRALCRALNEHNLRICRYAREHEDCLEDAVTGFYRCLGFDAGVGVAGVVGIAECLKLKDPRAVVLCISTLVGVSITLTITCYWAYYHDVAGCDAILRRLVEAEQLDYRNKRAAIWSDYRNCPGANGDPVPDFPRKPVPHPVEVDIPR